ncbi:MAG: methyltransferase [Phycisphaerae bacterium]
MLKDVESLNDLSWGFRSARAVQVACNLEIFTILDREGPLSVEALSTLCRTKEELTDKLLIACCAMELLVKDGGKYKNTDYADAYLVRGRPLYQGDIIGHASSVWNFWSRLEDEIRLEGVKSDPVREHRNFILGMDNLAGADRAENLAGSLDLYGRRKLLDVGGGPGSYSIALCRRNPKLKAVVFDLPATIAIAREVIVREKMEKQVSVQEGSWDTDEFGEGNDVVLFSNVLHGPASEAEMKLAKARRSMAQGGLLVVQEFVLNDEKSGPLVPSLFNIMVGAYSRRELFDVIETAGFSDPKVVFSSERYGNTVVVGRRDRIAV